MPADRSRTVTAPRPAPKLQRLSRQELTTTADYGNRNLIRVLYRAPSREEIRGTELAVRTADGIDAFYKDQVVKSVRDAGKHEVYFKVLPKGTYQVDLLEPLPPMPNVVHFADVYPKYRDELADGLKLILGMSEGKPFVSDADLWPHAIVGGAAGGGKTGFIYSLVGQIGDRSPTIIRLALADMAGTGLAPFARLPHAIAPLAVSLPELVTLAESVTAEMMTRQTFFRSVFEVRRPNGTTATINGFNDLRYWNSFAVGIERPDLTLPRVGFLIDEWKMAMNGSEESKQFVDLTAGIMRLGRKWGMRVWPITQAPRKGTTGDQTFPGDIMNNADTRIGMAKGADQIFWSLVFRNRSWSEDRDLLLTPQGDIPPGRGMISVGGAIHPFQSLWISDEPDEFDTFSSELTRLVAKQVAKWNMKKSPAPAARLLGERPYALAAPGIVVIDPSQPGDQAVSIREGELLASAAGRPKPTSAPSVTGRWRAEQPLPAPPVEEDIEDSALPRMPSQAELLDLSAHILLRALFVWQQEASDRGDELVGVSLRNYREWLAERDLQAGNTQRLAATMNALELAGVLSERQYDKRRRLEVLPYSSAVAQLDDWLADGGETVQDNAQPVGEDETDAADEGSDESGLRGEEDSLFAETYDETLTRSTD